MTGRGTRLALDGGTPVRKQPILPGWPGGLLIGAEEKAQVLEVLESQSLYRHYGPHPRHNGKATLRKGQFPRTDEILRQAIHIDLHPLLAESDVDDIVTAVDKVATALL